MGLMEIDSEVRRWMILSHDSVRRRALVLLLNFRVLLLHSYDDLQVLLDTAWYVELEKPI
jgi:hypothetical protein